MLSGPKSHIELTMTGGRDTPGAEGLRPNTRTPVIPLRKLHEVYDDRKAIVERLIQIDITDNDSFDSPSSLMAITSDVKSALKEFISSSENLTAKLINQGVTDEAQQVRKDRFAIRKEVKEMITLINTILQRKNCDMVSNVDTSSTLNGDIAGSLGTSKPSDLERVLSLPVSSMSEPTLPKDLNIDPIPVVLEPSCSRRTTTFKELLSPKYPEDSNLFRTCADIWSNPKKNNSAAEQTGATSTHGEGRCASFAAHPVASWGKRNFEEFEEKKCYPNDKYSYYEAGTKPKLSRDCNQFVSNRTHRQIDAASQHLIKQQLLSKSEEPFNGEPHEYQSWLLLLQGRMKGIELDALDHIAILSANTSGEPHKLVENFKSTLGGDPQETLDSLKQALYRKFGTSVHICSTLTRKLREFPCIKPPSVETQLSNLADLCKIIELNISRNRDLCVFNASEGQERVWTKLPEFLLRKWRSLVHQHTSKFHDLPEFSVMVKFLEDQAEELNNPYFFRNIEPSYKPSRSRNMGAYRVEAETPKYCIYHKKGGHTVYDCRTFASLGSNDKKKFVRQEKLCYNCLGKHYSSACDSLVECSICSRGHCTAMHSQKSNTPRPTTTLENGTVQAEESAPHSGSLCTALCGNPKKFKSCSKVLLCNIFHESIPSKILKCYVILDEQSSSTFMDPSAAKFLGVTGVEQNFILSTMSGYKTKQTGMEIHGLRIAGVGNSRVYNLPPVLTSDFVPDCRSEVATPSIVSAHSHISNLSRHFTPYDETAEVLFLVGRDCSELMHTKCYGDKHPYAHKTPIGWALVGSTCLPYRRLKTPESEDHEHFIVNKTYLRDSPSEDCFQEFNDDEEKGLSQEDKRFIDQVEKSITVNNDGNIVISLPFRQPGKIMPNNRQAVYCRTRNTLNRMKAQTLILNHCLDSMEKSLKLGHVEVVPQSELSVEDGRAWWLPVFVVTSANKKPRLVFDSSATYEGTSLNSVLLQGPDSINRLRGVLMRYRRGEVGYSADIESMFYNFYIPDDDKNFLRFFWFKDNNPNNQLQQYRGCVHLFGNSPSPAVAQFGLSYAVGQSVSDCQYSEISREFITRNFYVDDALGSASSVEEAVATLQGAREILSKYKIRLHKIVSNKREMIEKFPKSELSSDALSAVHKTLGLEWDIEKDLLYTIIDIPIKPFTRRGLLSSLNSIYDPLGVCNPVSNTGKCLVREIMSSCEGVQDWDRELPPDYRK